MANTYTPTNLIQGPADLYVGAFGATEPADTTVNTAPPASSWTGVGTTQGGVTLTINQSFSSLSVDQLVDQVGRRLTARDLQIKTNMAEVTLANLALALNDSVASSGAGFSALDPVVTSSGVTPTYRAYMLDGVAPALAAGTQMRRRVIVRKALMIDNVATAYAKETQGVLPVTFGAHYVSAAINPFHIVDQTV